MKFIKNILGITELEEKISCLEKSVISKLSRLEKSIIPGQETNHKVEVFKLLKNPMSTSEIARRLKLSRSYISRLLNALEREGRIYEHLKKGRIIFYKRNPKTL